MSFKTKKPALTLVPTKTDNDELFFYLAGSKLPISVKTRGDHSFAFVAKFSGKVDGNSKTFWLSYPANNELFSFQETLSKHLDSVFIATIQNRGTIYGVSFQVLYFNEQGIFCKFPDSLHQINRRAVKRVKVQATIGGPKILLELSLPTVTSQALRFPLQDLSIHGLSFSLPTKLQPYFIREQITHGKIYFGGKVIPVVMEVRNLFAHNDISYPFKVGMKFVKVSAQDQVELHYLVDSFKTSI